MATFALRQLDELHAVLNHFPWRGDELVVSLEQRPGDPLDRLGAAVTLARELNQLSDDLVGYFVGAARQAGHSWSQIGAALGTSKQAAQQRFAAPDLSRYTDRARRAVEKAAQGARRLGHRWIGSEHVLLGLAEVTDGVAAKALTSLGGASADRLQAKIAEFTHHAEQPPSAEAPLSPGAATLLSRLAPAEATALGHSYIGTEHVLLGMLRRPEGVAATVLQALSVDVDGLRQMVLDLMSGNDPIDLSE